MGRAADARLITIALKIRQLALADAAANHSLVLSVVALAGSVAILPLESVQQACPAGRSELVLSGKCTNVVILKIKHLYARVCSSVDEN